MNIQVKLLWAVFCFIEISAQNYEDKRCRCVCPSILAFNNTWSMTRKLYIANVPPSKCNCDGVVLPHVGDQVVGREQEYCIRCECKFQTRDTTIIKVVVIIVVWVIMLLLIYMGFLLCLEPLRKRKGRYQRPPILTQTQTEEDRHLLVACEDEN